MHFSVLGSGSRGNSVYIQSKDAAILIDAGFSCKEIITRLSKIGKDIEPLHGLLLTHEHQDHICGAGTLSRRYKIPVLANDGTLRGGEKRLGKLFAQQEFTTGETLCFRDLEIRPFRISHDTLDPVGYVISDGQHSIGYCTDTGKVTHLMSQRLSNCDALILEFNHDPDMLRNGPYPLALQQRVRSSQGHLANEDAAAFLQQIVHDRLRYVILAHLSETNNLPELALQSAATVQAQPQLQYILSRQSLPLPLISLA
jgi:phosphoribosyl 1,2-cyclic phosphodiesterase